MSFQTNVHDAIVHHLPLKYNGEPIVAMRRIVLFVGGASHATLLSFAPLVIVDILRKKDENQTSMPDSSGTWNVVSRYIAILVAAYLIGNALGIFIGYSTGFGRRMISDAKHFSRITGVILALHLFCLGSGSWELPTRLCFIRLIMGILVGLVSHNVTASRNTTNNCEKEYFDEQDPILGSPIMNTNHERTKVLLSGFAVSTLFGGLLYNPLRHSTLFTVLTGGCAWSSLVASLFFVGVVRASERVLQLHCLKRLSREELGKSSTHGQSLEEGMIATNGDILMNSPPRLLKRRTGGKNIEGLSPRLLNRGRLGSYNRGRLLSQSSGSNRGRLLSQSSESSDRFFDCESQGNDSFEEQELLIGYSNDLGEEDHANSIAIFFNRRCIFEDGTPASVPAGLCPSIPPETYKEKHKSEAMSKWSETQRWRMKSRAWKILDMPHPWFPKIKDHVSSRLHGISRMGYPVVYEKPRDMYIKSLFQNGLEVSDMIHNYVFFLEYMSHMICNKPEVRKVLDQRPEEQSLSKWGFIIVWDMTNFSLTANASASVMKYLSQADGVNSLHYPDSMVRGFAINTPFWFSGAFRTVKSVLPSSLKIDVLSSSNQLDGLRAHIDDDQIPKEFGGSSMYKLGEHPFETDLHELAQMLNSRKDSESDHEIEFECGDVPNYMSQELFSDDHTSQIKGSIGASQVCNPNDDNGNTRGSLPPLCEPPSGFIDIRTDCSIQTEPLQYNEEPGGKKTKMKLHHSEEYVFILVSIMHSLLCTILGSLETILPLWLMSPHKLGGLGYGPSRAGILYFSSSIVLMLLLRTKLSRLVFHIPEKASLRGCRIGVGAQAFFLILLPFIPAPSSYDNFLTMSATILVGTSLAIASMIGTNSIATLHITATTSYVEMLSLQCDTRTSLGSLINKIVNVCKRGGLTYAMAVGGEIMGAIIVMLMYPYSTGEETPLPLGASLTFYTAASLCAILYMASFSLSLKLGGKQNKQDGALEDQGVTCRCAPLGDIYAITIGDVASLIDSTRGKPSIYAEEVFNVDAKTT